MAKLIVYACPVGELSNQLDAFFVRSRAECGKNAAHDYMPHCTLTGFFHDDPAAIPLYLRALEKVVADFLPTRPTPVITIHGMRSGQDFHYLELESDWIKRMIAAFANIADSPTRQESLRLKEWLHLSLAYSFPSEQGDSLRRLAEEMVNPAAPVQWELRFYEQLGEEQWQVHGTWQLSDTE